MEKMPGIMPGLSRQSQDFSRIPGMLAGFLGCGPFHAERGLVEWERGLGGAERGLAGRERGRRSWRFSDRCLAPGVAAGAGGARHGGHRPRRTAQERGGSRFVTN